MLITARRHLRDHALARPAARPFALCLQGLAALAEMNARARQRRALARLDTRMLEDVGLSPAAARREVRKPRWAR